MELSRPFYIGGVVKQKKAIFAVDYFEEELL